MSTDETDAAGEIEQLLSELEDAIETRDFRPRAEAVQATMKGARLHRDTRQSLWDRYQSLWARRREYMEQRARESEEFFSDYRDRLQELCNLPDFVDGMIMNSSDWNGVGNKLPAARVELRRIQTEMKGDHRLMRNHREALYRLAQDAFSAINQAQESVYHNQGQVANRLLNEADSAVSSLPIRDAWEILKANSAQVRSLYLSPGDREMYHDAFDGLWTTLKVKKEEAHTRWRERQEEGLRKLREALERCESALERVRQNISDNEERLSSSRSDEYTTRIEGWLSDGREKESSIESSISSLEAKIRDAEHRLNG